MKEIGGYFEFEKYKGSVFHENAVALNSGRNCLAYLIEVYKIKTIWIPYYLCDCIESICKKFNVNYKFYNIKENFMPSEIHTEENEWIYVVNYYNLLTDDQLLSLKTKYKNLIFDYTHAYFRNPVKNVPTIYTCRKFFGVSDGAFLYTDKLLSRQLNTAKSFYRITHVIGRFENNASEFFNDYHANEEELENQPVAKMSSFTKNLLKSFDYERIKNKRSANFNILNKALKSINQLEMQNIEGAFTYPLYIKNAIDLRKKLVEKKIYIPTLWPNVLSAADKSSVDFCYAKNILPLPCDQRYGEGEMEYIINKIFEKN